MRKNIIIIILIALALILGRWLINIVDKAKATNARKNIALPSVVVEDVKAEDVIRQFEAPARVMAKYRVEVLARISGYLTKSYFKEGDYVKAGQTLFEIEPQEYQYAASRAKANLDNAKSQADYYQKQLARYEELVRQDYVARSDYDNILVDSETYVIPKSKAMAHSPQLPIILGLPQRMQLQTNNKVPELDFAMYLIMKTIRDFSEFEIRAVDVKNPDYYTILLRYNGGKTKKVIIPVDKTSVDIKFIALRTAMSQAAIKNVEYKVFDLSFKDRVICK